MPKPVGYTGRRLSRPLIAFPLYVVSDLRGEQSLGRRLGVCRMYKHTTFLFFYFFFYPYREYARTRAESREDSRREITRHSRRKTRNPHPASRIPHRKDRHLSARPRATSTT